MTKNFNLESLDKDYLFHPVTNLKSHLTDEMLILEKGEGIYVFDRDGKQYIDGLAGLWCTSLGHGVSELAEVAKEQMTTLGYSTLFANNKLGKPEKKKILARKKGYHGVTVASASMTGLPNQHKLFDLPKEHFIHTETPHYFKERNEGETEADYLVRLTKSLEELIEKEGA